MHVTSFSFDLVANIFPPPPPQKKIYIYIYMPIAAGGGDNGGGNLTDATTDIMPSSK